MHVYNFSYFRNDETMFFILRRENQFFTHIDMYLTLTNQEQPEEIK